jgi:hypothetical protein
LTSVGNSDRRIRPPGVGAAWGSMPLVVGHRVIGGRKMPDTWARGREEEGVIDRWAPCDFTISSDFPIAKKVNDFG